MLLSAVLMFICLLLRSGSSAPLTSDGNSSSASSSDEDLQLPAVFPVVGVASPKVMAIEAPPSVIVKVEDTKTNSTLSFAIFILAEEEEGSGAQGGGRSDENSSSSQDDDIINDISSEETNKQESDTSSQPMNEEYNRSSEEMMSDQPMFSEEEADDVNNTVSDWNKWNPKLTLSDDFDDFQDFRLGSGLQEVFRSFQEVIDLLPGHQGVMEVKGSHHRVLGSSFSPLTGFSLSSDESSETFGKMFGGAPQIWSMLKDTMSQQSGRSSSQVGVSLNSSSSEESQEAVVGLRTSIPGLSRVWSPEVSSSSEEVVLVPDSSSSSPALVSLLIPSPQTPAESDSSGSRSTSDSPGLDSGTDSESTELHPDPIPTSDPNLSPESNFNPSVGIGSEVCQEECEEAPTIKVATDANSDVSRGANPTVDYRTNTASIAVSSEASIDGKLDSSVKDTEADLNFEATTHSSNDVSIDAVYSTSLPSMHVSSGAGIDVNTDAISKLSVEDDDASTDGTVKSAISMQPTATTEYRTNPPDFRASTDVIANVEKEHSGVDVSVEANPDVNNHSEEKMAFPLPPPVLPPRIKKPYRFGFLGPLSHSYGNQPVTMEMLAVRHHHNV